MMRTFDVYMPVERYEALPEFSSSNCKVGRYKATIDQTKIFVEIIDGGDGVKVMDLRGIYHDKRF